MTLFVHLEDYGAKVGWPDEYGVTSSLNPIVAV
jgi:hypothetical protein